MSSGITIPSVTTLCKTHPNLLSTNRVEQIKALSSIIEPVFQFHRHYSQMSLQNNPSLQNIDVVWLTK